MENIKNKNSAAAIMMRKLIVRFASVKKELGNAYLSESWARKLNDKVVELVCDGNISIVGLKHKVEIQNVKLEWYCSKIFTLKIDLKCGDKTEDIDLIGCDELEKIFQDNSDEVSSLLASESSEDFIGRFFEVIVLGFIPKFYDFGLNLVSLKRLLEKQEKVELSEEKTSTDQDVKKVEKEEKKVEKEIKLDDQKMMESLGAVIGGIAKGTGALNIKGKVYVKVKVDASRSRDKGAERKLSETIKVNGGVELGIDLNMSGSIDGELNGNCNIAK